jgi:hypothetical protein
VFFTLVNFALRPHADWVEKVEQPIIGVGNGVPWLTVVPGRSVPWYPWVFALATVVEQNVLGLGITGLAVFYGGRYLERAWGSHEFTKFVLFVAMIPNVLAFLLYLAAYVLTGKSSMMYVFDFSALDMVLTMQAPHHLRRHCHPSRLPRVLQAAGSRTHCSHREGPRSYARQALPRHLPSLQHHLRHNFGH